MPVFQMELPQMGAGQMEVIEATEFTLAETQLTMLGLWQKQVIQFMGIPQ